MDTFKINTLILNIDAVLLKRFNLKNEIIKLLDVFFSFYIIQVQIVHKKIPSRNKIEFLIVDSIG